MNTATALLTLTKEIRALRRQLIKPKLAVVQGGRPALADGEIYVGIATDPDGKSVHHVILLPDDVIKNWTDAKAWAASIGGELPTRTEALLLFRTQRDQFKRDLYWTSEQRAGGPSYAWYQNFGWGDQYDNDLSWELRARAVRRVPVEERNSG